MFHYTKYKELKVLWGSHSQTGTKKTPQSEVRVNIGFQYQAWRNSLNFCILVEYMYKYIGPFI